MRKLLCIVLIILISFSATIVLAEQDAENVLQNQEQKSNSQEGNSTENETNGLDLNSQKEELEEQINQANEELTQTQSALSENLQQVEKLDERIKNSENELQELTTKVEQLKTSISQVEQELQEVTEKYNNQQKLLEERVIALYEIGEVDYLDILLHSNSLSEFISSYYVISEIIELDNDLLKNIGEKKDEITLSKEKLDNQKQELASLVESQTRTSKVLQNTKTIRENYIAKLSEEEKQKQAQIDEMTAQYEEINKQILSLAEQGLDTSYIGGEFAWPVPGYTTITSKYGMRVHPITGQYKLHTGVDIGAPRGSNFIAANDGVVVKAEYNSAYGNMVIIDHGGGISTLYAHGDQILVEVGQTVKRGQSILVVGSTGYSTGPHAHFEVRINGVVTDPMPYITNQVVPGSEEKEEEQDTQENAEIGNTIDQY